MSVEMLELRVLLDVTFSVDTTQGSNDPISTLHLRHELRPGEAALPATTFCARGGNRWTAYNWTTNASNAVR